MSVDRFDLNFEEDVKKMERKIESAAKNAAGKAFENIVRHSPVWSGHYVRSHRIGVNEKDESVSPGLSGYMGGDAEKIPPKASEAEAKAFRAEATANEMAKLSVVENFKQIHISNNSGNAEAVEYGDGRTPAYGLYRKGKIFAEAVLEENLNRIR